MKTQLTQKQMPSLSKQPKSAIIQEGIHQLAEVLTEDMLNNLREAATDNKEWENAVHNPTHFLEKHKIELPEGVELRLLDVSIGGEPHSFAPGFCRNGLVPIYKEERTYGCTKMIMFTKVIHDPRLEGGQTEIGQSFICLEWGYSNTIKQYCALPVAHKKGKH